jgi:hypothetical protein
MPRNEPAQVLSLTASEVVLLLYGEEVPRGRRLTLRLWDATGGVHSRAAHVARVVRQSNAWLATCPLDSPLTEVELGVLSDESPSMLASAYPRRV